MWRSAGDEKEMATGNDALHFIEKEFYLTRRSTCTGEMVVRGWLLTWITSMAVVINQLQLIVIKHGSDSLITSIYIISHLALAPKWVVAFFQFNLSDCATMLDELECRTAHLRSRHFQLHALLLQGHLTDSAKSFAVHPLLLMYITKLSMDD